MANLHISASLAAVSSVTELGVATPELCLGFPAGSEYREFLLAARGYKNGNIGNRIYETRRGSSMAEQRFCKPTEDD